MLDIQFIRDNPDLVEQKSREKGYPVDVRKLLELDTQRRTRLTQVEELRARRNTLTNEIGKNKPAPEQIEQGKQLKEEIAKLEQELGPLETDFDTALKAVPNMPLEDVPVGDSEDENVVIKEWGAPRQFDFEVKTDAELGEMLDIIDKERATKVAASRFAYLKGGLVQMQFAIIQFVIQTLSDEKLIQKLISENDLNLAAKPFVPVLPPAVANTATYETTGRLNSEEQTYKLADDDLWLNASAEHTLAPMYINEILPEDMLPIRYLGYTTAFRREAGTYGKDTEGIFRMHQFDKLEMEVFSTPETAPDEHKLQIAIQEYLLQQLNLPYQLLLKCTADIGKPNARGVDINTWMPAQKAYRETHTADYISDYQTRRMKTRFKDKNGEIRLLHTNDATAFALGRILKAIVENYQTADGHISVPDVLRPYMGGREQI